MARIVNLKTARKQAARDKAREKSAESAALHGESKPDKRLRKAEADKAARDLDGKKRET